MSDKGSYAIVGGTSCFGFALAEKLVARGDDVWIGGRSQARLDAALGRLGDKASGQAIDTGNRASVAAFFTDAPPLTGLFTPAATYSTAAFRNGDTESSEHLFQANSGDNIGLSSKHCHGSCPPRLCC